MASIVLLREVAHSVAPALQRPPIEILDHLRTWVADCAEHWLALCDPQTQAGTDTVLPAFCPTAPHRAARPRISLNDQSPQTLADQGEYDSGGPCRTEPDESHPG
jgi:hypothetical protein